MHVWLKVTAILVDGCILPIGGFASVRVCACSLRSRLVMNDIKLEIICIWCIYSLVDVVTKVPPSVQVAEAHVIEVFNEEGATAYSLPLYSSNWCCVYCQ